MFNYRSYIQKKIYKLQKNELLLNCAYYINNIEYMIMNNQEKFYKIHDYFDEKMYGKVLDEHYIKMTETTDDFFSS